MAEFGAGTGVYTGESLKRLHPDADFLAVEIDPNVVSTLRERFDDPRLRMINDSAENVQNYLNGSKVYIIVSCITCTSLPKLV